MPVLVTGPESTLGTQVVRRLAATGGEVRAFCAADDAPVAEFRQLGVICAVGSLLDEGHLETAMEQAHTVVHLPVGPLASAADRIVDHAATVVGAAVGAKVQRILCLSVPGATPQAGDPLRRAAADVEQLMASTPCEVTVLRASLVDSPELRAMLARTPLDRSALNCPVAPLLPSDLATALLWLDERRDVEEGHEILAADGPDVVLLRAHLRAVGITPLTLVGRVVERLRQTDTPLLAESFGAPWTSGPEIASVWALSGLEPRSTLDAVSSRSEGGRPA